MSTVALCWWGSPTRHLRLGLAMTLMVGGLLPASLIAQVTGAAGVVSQRQAHATLEATVQALGGPAWLGVRTSREHVRIGSFFQGNPTGEVTDAVISREHPNKERVELDKGQVVEIYSGRNGWEITYKGKKSLPSEKVKDHLRWQRHSLRRVLDRWLGDPATVVLNDGAEQIERHSAEKFTLMDAANNAVTLDVDSESHLPLQLSFEWRDPRFHDKNVDAVEFDNYHRIDGIATPFTVTRTHNGDIVEQMFLLRVEYNAGLAENLFDPDYAAAHLK
ncbi:MAG TPA: hypothetical protein VMF56_07405 [Acidobacteriaceae bacterium]|nr:hypothetical protein [Acidobacteriaceae bacterium]